MRPSGKSPVTGSESVRGNTAILRCVCLAVRKTTTSLSWTRKANQEGSRSGGSGAPIWSPDGQRIAFQASGQGASTLRQRLVSGGGDEEELLDIGGFIVPTDWSADGQFIAYNRVGADGSSDIWVLALAEREPAPFAQTAKNEAYATFYRTAVGSRTRSQPGTPAPMSLCGRFRRAADSPTRFL